PVVPPGIQQFFLPGGATEPLYSPTIIGAARVAFADSKLGIDLTRDICYQATIGEGAIAVDWANAKLLEGAPAELTRTAAPGATFEPLPAAATQPKNYATWEKSFGKWLGQAERLELMRHPDSKLASKPGESERDFRVRVQDTLRSSRDEAIDAIRAKY